MLSEVRGRECSSTHAETEEPTLRQVMDQFNTRMDVMEARQAQQSSPRKFHKSDRGAVSHICDFCFTKTGNKFFHAEINCNRKNKFSQKVKSKN
jgi:hypothetical protein